MLRLEDVSLAFGKKEVLRHVSFDFPETGIVSVRSPSGRGKSTLLHVIAGLYKPDSGRVTNTYPSLSYDFQDHRLFPWLTAKDNLKVVLPDDSADALADAWLEKVFLADASGLYPDELSGGMKGRVVLARALANDAPLVLLDEPFAGLDEDLHEKMLSLVRREAETRLILLVSHDPNDLSPVRLDL